MSSGLIGGQDDANDVSPSGKLMLKYGPGWTIRGAQAGPIGTKEETRSGEEENCAGDKVVTGSINESSVEIVSGENIGATNWTVSWRDEWWKGVAWEEWLESKYECVCWIFVFHTMIILFIFFGVSFIESKNVKRHSKLLFWFTKLSRIFKILYIQILRERASLFQNGLIFSNKINFLSIDSFFLLRRIQSRLTCDRMVVWRRIKRKGKNDESWGRTERRKIQRQRKKEREGERRCAGW